MVISKYIEGARPRTSDSGRRRFRDLSLNAREIEFDGVGCNGEIINYAISEHVEESQCPKHRMP